MPKSDSGNRSSVRSATLALCLALLGAASMLYYHLHLFIPNVLQVRAAQGLGNGYAFGDDFYPVWLAAHLSRLDHRNPYSPEMTRQIQIGLFGRPLNPLNPTDPPADYRELAYPAFTELLVWPVAGMQFSQLRPILALLLTLITVASLWLWMLALQWRVHPLWFAVIVVLALCNYQVLEALFAEQPGLIVGCLLAGAALALRRNRLLLAGVLMALTLIKPQMTLLAIGYLLLWSLSDRHRAKLLGRLSDHACVPGRFFSDSLAALDRAMDQNPARISPLCDAPVGYRPARQLESLSRQSANHRSVGSLLSTGVAKSSRDSRFARLLVDLEFVTRHHIGHPAARAGYL